MTIADTTRPRPRERAGAMRDRPRRREAEAAPLVVIVLVVALLIPGTVSIGPLAMTPARFYLLLVTVPAVIALAVTERVRAHDWLFAFFALWTVLCLGLNYGLNKALEGGGAFVIETLGAYALVRVALKRPEQVLGLANLLFWLVAVMLPFAIVEAVTGQRLVAQFFSAIMGFGVAIQGDQRLGLYRAAVAFGHPILFGVFCASVFAFVWYRAAGMLSRLTRSAVVGLATFLSLSAGGVLPMTLQLAMIVTERYSRAIRNRATVFFWWGLGLYVFLEIASNRGAFGLMASYLSFNPHTAWYRMAIWDNAIDDVMRHPIFGMRGEEWTRLAWMTPSIDNFWLVQMLRGGLPATGALALSIVLILRQLMAPPDAALSEVQRRMRRAALYSVTAFSLAAATVDLFSNLLPIFSVYIGVAAALARMEPQGDPAAADAAAAGPMSRRRNLRGGPGTPPGARGPGPGNPAARPGGPDGPAAPGQDGPAAPEPPAPRLGPGPGRRPLPLRPRGDRER